MRRYLVDAAVGLGLFALIMLAEFAVTLPFGSTQPTMRDGPPR